jgi:hypothetical protein
LVTSTGGDLETVSVSGEMGGVLEEFSEHDTNVPVGKPIENPLQFVFGIEWHSLMRPKDVAAFAEQHSFRTAAS